jgi:hypothetical protein
MYAQAYLMPHILLLLGSSLLWFFLAHFFSLCLSLLIVSVGVVVKAQLLPQIILYIVFAQHDRLRMRTTALGHQSSLQPVHVALEAAHQFAAQQLLVNRVQRFGSTYKKIIKSC